VTLAYLAFTASAGAADGTTPVSAPESPSAAAVESQPTAAAEPVVDSQASDTANVGSQGAAPAEDVSSTPQYHAEKPSDSALEAAVKPVGSPAVSAVAPSAVSRFSADSVSDRALNRLRNRVAIRSSISRRKCKESGQSRAVCSRPERSKERPVDRVRETAQPQYQTDRVQYQPRSEACDNPITKPDVRVSAPTARTVEAKLDARLAQAEESDHLRVGVFGFVSTPCSRGPSAQQVASELSDSGPSALVRAGVRRKAPDPGRTFLLVADGGGVFQTAAVGRGLTSGRPPPGGVGSARAGGVDAKSMRVPPSAPRSSAGLADSRLMLQIGVLLGLAYLVFLTLWVWATRLRPRLRGGSGL
jgi:hypothetical protein